MKQMKRRLSSVSTAAEVEDLLAETGLFGDDDSSDGSSSISTASAGVVATSANPSPPPRGGNLLCPNASDIVDGAAMFITLEILNYGEIIRKPTFANTCSCGKLLSIKPERITELEQAWNVFITKGLKDQRQELKRNTDLATVSPDILAPALYLEIRRFISHIKSFTDISPECIVMAVVYLARITLSAGQGCLLQTWRPLVFACLLAAHKYWDDDYLANSDFALTYYPEKDTRDTNALERALMKMLDYRLTVSPALYARTYLTIRAISQIARDREGHIALLQNNSKTPYTAVVSLVFSELKALLKEKAAEQVYHIPNYLIKKVLIGRNGERGGGRLSLAAGVLRRAFTLRKGEQQGKKYDEPQYVICYVTLLGLVVLPQSGCQLCNNTTSSNTKEKNNKFNRSNYTRNINRGGAGRGPPRNSPPHNGGGPARSGGHYCPPRGGQFAQGGSTGPQFRGPHGQPTRGVPPRGPRRRSLSFESLDTLKAAFKLTDNKVPHIIGLHDSSSASM